MDFLGRKRALSKQIFEKITTICPDHKNLVFLDACAGSGTISQEASTLFKLVISNDLLKSSNIFVSGNTMFPMERLDEAEEHIKRINKLKGRLGFFAKNYSPLAERMYFTVDNAKKLDSFSRYIHAIEDQQLKDYLLLCLVEGMCRIINTAGTQEAFLKAFKKRALDPLILRPESTIGKANVILHNENILSLLKSDKTKENILYIDPPYNQRQYGSVYHLYETLVRNDQPKIKGVAGKRNTDDTKSLFCSSRAAEEFLIEIFKATKAQFVFISYSTDALLSEAEVINSARSCGFNHLDTLRIEYRRFKSDSSDKRQYNGSELNELLFCFEKQV